MSTVQPAEAGGSGRDVSDFDRDDSQGLAGQGRRYRLGVLFVHGIGEQRRGEALTQCAEPVFRAVAGWAGSAPQPAVVSLGPATVDLNSPLAADLRGDPMHVVLTADSVALDQPTQWLFAESWWAARFAPPRMSQLFSWSLRLSARAARQLVRPRAAELKGYTAAVAETAPSQMWQMSADLAAGILMGMSSDEPDPIHWPGADRVPVDENEPVSEQELDQEFVLMTGEGLAWLKPIAGPIVGGTYGLHLSAGIAGGTYLFAIVANALALIFTLVAAPAAIVLTAVTSIALKVSGWLPRIGRGARAAQRKLAASVGDSYVWQESPVRRAQLLGQLEHDVTWMARRCDRIAIVAHSQGSALTHEYLRTRNVPPQVALLVTYGTALRLLNCQAPGTEVNTGLTEADLAIPGQGTTRSWFDFAATLDPIAVEPLPNAGDG